jgi:hypothetical protein
VETVSFLQSKRKQIAFKELVRCILSRNAINNIITVENNYSKIIEQLCGWREALKEEDIQIDI